MGIVQGGVGPTLSPLSCLMQETESSAWVITTAPSTPRSMAHTEQGPSFSDFPPGPPVPARPPSIHPANFRLRIFHKMFRDVPSPNVSTKVSNVPHTSFFVSLLMLSTGFSSMHSPRYDITVTHKD